MFTEGNLSKIPHTSDNRGVRVLTAEQRLFKPGDKPGDIGMWFNRFMLERRFQRVSPKTLECYENSYKFFAPVLDTLKINFNDPKGNRWTGPSLQFREEALSDALKDKVESELRSAHSLSPTSINIYVRVMNTFLNWLVAEKIFENKFRLRPVKEPTGERRQVFTDDEVERLIKYKPKSFNQHRAWTIAICMLDTGVRIDEALSIQTPDVDFNSDLIFIATGKGEKSGHVPVSEMFRPILYRYMTRTQPEQSAFVFGTTKGTKMSQRNALRDIRVVERAAGVRSLSWHCYRHTMATGYLRRGGNIYKLQRILRHADIRTTQKYLHLATDFITEGHEAFSSLAPIKSRRQPEQLRRVTGIRPVLVR